VGASPRGQGTGPARDPGIVFRTGVGIGFFKVAAHRTRKAALRARSAAGVVRADVRFISTAVAVQPIIGVLLALGFSGFGSVIAIIWSTVAGPSFRPSRPSGRRSA
jgi:uncharacterized membrane protein